ncbi:MAG TPA: PTS sugar transporter subunit IIA [Candidatus Agrococcus pullicola]|uniref:Ascorbate-specific PTS system EIIA component n=1 Tax=Candidatus Agrococcus pullicola TaxID=2838429 RepID=A0A9D1YW36_9MICO|nr:PTS sugar transporter subunit IIA [Candidatus Agrococcus pullicola]
MTALNEALGDITVGAAPSDWRAAITLAGDGLVRGGFTTDEYTEQMISAIEELGPYIVIAPGFALAHSRPSEAVLGTGLSWVQLAQPVEFGSANDPVDLIVGLAAKDHDGHIAIMSQLAGILASPEHMQSLKAADSESRVREIITSIENGIT